MEETAYLWCLLERMWNHDPQRRPTASVARDEDDTNWPNALEAIFVSCKSTMCLNCKKGI